MQQFMQTAYNDWNRERQLEQELATATASILPENSEDFQKNCNSVNVSSFVPKVFIIDFYLESTTFNFSKWSEAFLVIITNYFFLLQPKYYREIFLAYCI